MLKSRSGKVWTGKGWKIYVLVLLIIIIIGAVVIRVRMPRNVPIEISLMTSNNIYSYIYIDGAVNNPGCYVVKDGDTIDSLLQVAGKLKPNADIERLTLYIPKMGENEACQKVNINRAERWLLEALPGIGETLAERIIEYREQNGLFRNINELIMVSGITLSTYEKIKDYITVV
jgi:competence protein ComEA